MLHGRANFLLCHHHPAASSTLDAQAFWSIKLGDDVLLPVSAPGPASKGALHALPGERGRPVPDLAFTEESGMRHILAAWRSRTIEPSWLKPVFTSHVATALTSMARSGRGLAWGPHSLIEEDLARGTLVRAGDPSWDIPIEIHLFRSRVRQSQVTEAFWSLIADQAPSRPA